jgi:hypothetical protein
VKYGITFKAHSGEAMELSTIFIIMYVVFCLFMIANWMNRPRNKK